MWKDKSPRNMWTVHISNKGQEATRRQWTHPACTSIGKPTGMMIRETEDDSTEPLSFTKKNKKKQEQSAGFSQIAGK